MSEEEEAGGRREEVSDGKETFSSRFPTNSERKTENFSCPDRHAENQTQTTAKQEMSRALTNLQLNRIHPANLPSQRR